MGFDKRVVVALSVIALIFVPAAVLRAVCAGHSCDEPDEGAANVPFCSLPADHRAEIVAGFREGRSPNILVVTGDEPDGRVPIVLWGTGVAADAEIPPGVRLDSIAPTVAEVIGFERPHPDVRSGTAIPGVAGGSRPGLVAVIVVEGLSGAHLEGPTWTRLLDLAGDGAMTTDARIGSQPVDSAALTTTIGTGGMPRQHGITGRFVRNDAGKMVRAWVSGAPVSVIATLADDMDELLGQRPMIGLVTNSRSHRGLIGGDWYVDNDRDLFRPAQTPARAADAVAGLMEAGFGDDDVPDLLAVTFSGPPRSSDRAVGRIAGLAEEARNGAAVVVVGAGQPAGDNSEFVADIEGSIEGPTKLIEGSVPGGFFVDQDALARTGKTEDEVIDAVMDTGAFTDAFAAITVSFSRFC